MGTGTVSFADNALLALLTKASRGVALVSDMRTRRESVPPARASLCRRGRWVFAHDGTVEDRAYLLSRTSAFRACPGEPEADLLLAFLLTRLDESDLAESEASNAVDDVVRAAASEIVRRIGSFSFLLCDGTALYAHRFDRSLYLRERESSGRLPAVVVVASEPHTSEGWVHLEDRTLVRCRNLQTSQTSVSALDIGFLSGRDPRPTSEVELPFTD
ncbi:MAG TPA: class II glutamine amidotransferase [Labilithrix sp.]|nr:class II glutamine amidotransferase [Labilithrix sp.]